MTLSGALGVDYGSRKVAVVHPTRGVFAFLELPDSTDKLVALRLLADWMYSACVNAAPELVVVERPIQGMSRNVNTGLSLAMVAGALIVAADEVGAQVVLAEPSTWKKRVLGHGGLGKSEITEWLAREQPVLHARCGANQDLVDACCLALYGQALLA